MTVNSPPIDRWVRSCRKAEVPNGTADICMKNYSAVPFGTSIFVRASPTINCWAIIRRPLRDFLRAAHRIYIATHCFQPFALLKINWCSMFYSTSTDFFK